MKNFKLWNTLFGWLVFAVAAATYLLTMEPTASFWDCGEFISSAHKLDVGHPPGAPFFMLMGHFFSLFASDASHVAICVNAMSALASAFTILFLFWTITYLTKKLVGDDRVWKGVAILGAGVVGALAYTFSDTFWFSAVEGEVYASSSLFTAVVVWLMLKWDEQADERGSDRWLILIAYLMGLSIGVHLLNLLTIPALTLIYYFRRYNFTWKGAIGAFCISCLILAAILYGIVPGFPTVAGWFELLFVNTLGCPYNTGLAIYIVLTIVAIVWSVYETYVDRNRTRQIVAFVAAVAFAGIPFIGESVLIGMFVIAGLLLLLYMKRDTFSSRLLNTATLMIAVILVGYSSYAAIVIRSNADTPMDQNSPDNVFSLKYYLNREQYGDRPLFYGAVYNAPVLLDVRGNMCIPREKEGHAQYAPSPDANGPDKYIVTGHKTSYEMNPKFKMLFPRMYSSEGRHVAEYKNWGQIKGKKVRYEYCGQNKTDYVPTFGENLRFFFSYQVNYMYWRYFMWNFAGRQNDLQGYGELHKGNWVSGIPFIDNARLGDQDALPEELKNNKGHNVYYMLPLLLGLIGIVYQLRKQKEGGQSFAITFFLFFLTGLAIVLYLNQTPLQPRERDYAYAGSFYAFCIWIGLGVAGLIELINRLFKGDGQAPRVVVAIAMSLLCLGVPALMAEQNWDDHDRSQRYSCRDFGANYLRSCETQGVLFSNGDNDTFPLWYNQEVEEEGTDLRVCNLSYLQTDWYISQMKRPYYKSQGLPITWQHKDFVTGKNEVVYVDNRLGNAIPVKTAFDWVCSDKPSTKRDGESFIPSDKLFIPVDKAEVMASPVFAGRYSEDQITDRLNVKVGRRLTKSEMMVLEMISSSHFQRPIYFAVTVGNDYYQGLEPYFELTGLAYQVTPVRSANGQPRVNVEKMYDNMMHKFRYGNMNVPGIYIDENLMRMCRTHRMMFVQLADALVRQNDYKRAIEVLDRAEEELPGYNVPYDYTSTQMAFMYLEMGETEKAKAILEVVLKNCQEYVAWGESLNKEQLASVEGSVRQQAGIMQWILNQCRYSQLKEWAEQYAL